MPTWIRISAGDEHSLAIAKDGSLWAWGTNDDRQLGVGTPDRRGEQTFGPLQIGLERDWVAVAAGGRQSLALDRNGALWGWGSNAEGQCGTGPAARAVRVPTRVGSDRDWIAVAAGGSHGAALKKDGSLWTWGRLTFPPWVPARIEGSWTAVACGGYHVLAIAADGTLWTWGGNAEGQLGDGGKVDRGRPARVGSDPDWAMIAAGELHSAALRQDGTLWTWGYAKDGRLGIAAAAEVRREPGPVSGLWLAVACDRAATLALGEDGVRVWGSSGGRGSSELVAEAPRRLVAGGALWELQEPDVEAASADAAYDLDEWAIAIAAAVAGKIASSPPRDPIRSITLAVETEARWPWSFVTTDESGGTKRYDLDVQCDCALPHRVDDEDRLLDALGEEHAALRGELSFAWNELPGSLWRLALLDATARLPRELRKTRVRTASTLDVVVRIHGSAPLGADLVPDLVAAARDALREHFRNDKLLKRFGVLCFRRKKGRDWLRELRETKRRHLTAWF